MKKIILICLCFCFLSACSEKKPPLTPTQVVNGQSIVMPPEFFVLPQQSALTTQTAVNKE